MILLVFSADGLHRGEQNNLPNAILAGQEHDTPVDSDVDGVYDKDPRLYPDAMKFDWISYEKMRRLIAGGAQVLHDRSVELAQRFGLAIEVLSSFTGQPGTIVCAEESGT